MDASAREAPLSRFLMFRVSLEAGDQELCLSFLLSTSSLTNIATEYLEALSTVSSGDSTLLYACVLEAQKHGDKRQTAEILQRILATHDWNVPSNIHLPALLR